MPHEPEIVKIIDEHRLIDSESYERSYRTGTTQGLRPGYYVVCWPDGVHQTVYDEEARFMGPYSLYEHARLDIERVMQPSPVAAMTGASKPAH